MSLKGFRWNQITIPPVFVSQRCWQAWVWPTRLLDRVRVKVCGGFQAHWKKSRRGKISFHTKAEEQSHTEEKPCPVGELFLVSLTHTHTCSPKCLTKDTELPLDNKNLLPLNHRGSVHKRIAGACASSNGDSSWLLMGYAGKKSSHLFKAPMLWSWCVLKHPLFASFPSCLYIKERTKTL